MEKSIKVINLLLADVPWNFKAWSEATGSARSPSAHYPTLSIDQLKLLDLAPHLADDCVLFFWVVDWMAPALCQVVAEAWGFTYATKAWTWMKTSKNDPSKFIMGKGYYTRANPEDCWILRRGKPPGVADRSVPRWIIAPRLGHSAKPPQQYEYIDRLYPTLTTRLELFARTKQPGWMVWGNEVRPDIQLEFKEGD